MIEDGRVVTKTNDTDRSVSDRRSKVKHLTRSHRHKQQMASVKA